MEVSELTPKPHRLNERYEALFAGNRDIFDGARVLDLASHDGRYSFAALKTGAAHVTGVEVRESLIDKAQETFAFYGQDPETYRFVCGDVFEVLAREKFDVDVVLCLGYLYHTYRHTELMYRLHDLAPKHLIVDTMVMPGTPRTLRVYDERDSEATPPHPQPTGGWRARVNKTLATVTGYELRRASTKRDGSVRNRELLSARALAVAAA